MSITYSWTINDTLTYPTRSGLLDVVHTVNYFYTAVSSLTGSDGNNLSSSVYGAQNIPSPLQANFISLENLTDDNVIDWLTGSLDVDELNSVLDTKINMLTGSGVNTQD